MDAFTPIAYCHELERQRQNFDVGADYHNNIKLFKFYRYTYDPNFAARHRKLSTWLKQIHDRFGAFVWVLVALAGQFSRLRCVPSFGPYTDAIQDWRMQHNIIPAAYEKAKELLTHLETHKLDVFQRAKEVGKCRTSGAKRDSKRSNRATKNHTSNQRTTQTTLPPDPDSHLKIKELTHELRGTRKGIRNSTRVGQHNRVERNGEDSEQDRIEGNRQIDTNSRLLKSLEDHCKVRDDGLLYIQTEPELDTMLSQAFERPIFWKDYTRSHPLTAGAPQRIPEFLQFLEDMQVPTLEVRNYRTPAHDGLQQLQAVCAHLRSLGNRPEPWNCLDIRNQGRSCIPLPVHRADLVHRARRWKNQSVSKDQPQTSSYDHADYEFWLLSTRLSMSSIHADTAGQCTCIIGCQGKKIWFLPYKPSSDALQLYGSTNPRPFKDGWMKIEIMPGDLLIMPPGYPHAVFTPEDSLAFGANFYTLPHLGNSLCLLHQQQIADTDGLILSNEMLKKEDYLDFITMLEYCARQVALADTTSLIKGALRWGISNTEKDAEEIPSLGSDGFKAEQSALRVAIWNVLKKFDLDESDQAGQVV